MPRLRNEKGQEVYFHVVTKHDRIRYVVKGINCRIPDRDRRMKGSRTFSQEMQAQAWLHRNGFNEAIY